MNDLIINFAPTGMLMQKEDTPYIPLSVEEIIYDIKQACKIGISSVHLHARDKYGKPTYEKEIFEELIIKIREFAPDLVISVSTSGRMYNEFEKRTDVLNLTGKAKPDMASLTLSSLNFNKSASINEPDMIVKIVQKMNEMQIKPELEIFDLGMVNYAKYLIKKNYIKPPYYFNVILGNVACAQATLLESGVVINSLPSNSIVSLGGIGDYQLKVNSMAVAMGYGVRIGLEDNIWYDIERTKLASNQEYLERIHLISHAIGRKVCSPSTLRTMLHIR